MNLVLFGPPAVGKGTVAKLFAERDGFVHFSTGDLFRQAMADRTELGVRILDGMARGELVDDATTDALVKEHVEKLAGARILFDGYPRNVAQIGPFIALGQEFRIVSLTADEDLLISRMQKRSRELGRADDTLEVFRDRLQTYHATTAPVLAELPHIEVDGSGEPDVVYERVAAALI